jgi:AraC-like DNA-binding protein
VAKIAGVSIRRFRDFFSGATGIDCRRFLTWNRLHAAVLAMSRGDDLTTAARSARFADSAHLTRAFRAMFGISPSALSRSVRFISDGD